MSDILCFGGFATVVFLVALIVFRDAFDARAIRRQLGKRNFGILTAFGFTSVVAVDLWLMRILGVDMTQPGAICVGVFLGAFALAIVCFAWLVWSDLTERGIRRGRKHELDDDDDTLFEARNEPASPQDDQ